MISKKIKKDPVGPVSKTIQDMVSKFNKDPFNFINTDTTLKSATKRVGVEGEKITAVKDATEVVTTENSNTTKTIYQKKVVKAA